MIQKAGNFTEKDESSFLRMVWACHRRGIGVSQPGSRRGKVSLRPHQGQKWSQGWRDAEEKQGPFPKDEAVALHGMGTESQTPDSLCTLPYCLFHDFDESLFTLPPAIFPRLGVSSCQMRGRLRPLFRVLTSVAVTNGLMNRGVS